MSIGSARVTELQRPVLHIEELAQDDGCFRIGRNCWGAVTFRSEHLNPFEWSKFWERMTLHVDDEEQWTFHNARIALMPGSTVDNPLYVMVYERCEWEALCRTPQPS